MGIRAGLTVISAEALHEIELGGNPALDGATRYAIDSLWVDFHAAFKQQGPPLDKVIAGDTAHPQSTHSLEALGASYDYYCGFVSVSLVQSIADTLDGIDNDHIRRLFAPANVLDRDPDLYFFNQLRSAYSDAASGNNALMIVIA